MPSQSLFAGGSARLLSLRFDSCFWLCVHQPNKEAARLSADGSAFTILRTDDIGFALRIGDIILEVGRRGVNTPADFRKMVEERARSRNGPCCCA